MFDPSITYFPVGNGDTSLIKLSDGSTILIDCNITEASNDENNKEAYPVHESLLKELKTDKNNVYHLDSFILTHSDEDHCRGFSSIFYLGDPSKYSEDDRKKDLIILDELWFTPRLFSPHEAELSKSAEEFYKEAKRRIELYKNGNLSSKDAGNRLRVIGYSDNEELSELHNCLTVPGNSINNINGSQKSDFSFFIHAPFKKDIDSNWSERNDTSVVLQARFEVGGVSNAGLAFFGGDCSCAIFEEIIEKSSDDDLQWDLFLAPHHSSWYFFSEESYDDNPTPSGTITQFLDMHREGAYIIASCKPIKDDDDNPPHFQAAQIYKKIVGEDKFLVTMQHPNEKEPLPIHFIITRMGPQQKEPLIRSSIVSSAAIKSVIKTPQTYGK